MIHIPAMIPLSKIFTLILTAALASAFPDVLANNDVNIEDIFSKQDQNGIVHVIDHPSDQVAEPLIKRALQGYVKKPNSTIVTDPKKPHKENYPVSFTFKEAPVPQVRIRPSYDDDKNDDFAGQPCGIGFVTLVSDDGCTISITDDKGQKNEWLKESGKGHDISKGRRDYPKVLMPGTHSFDIEYSQTYYNPRPGKKDMDGITLFVTPVVVDISVRKQNAPTENFRVLLIKGESIEMALNKDLLGEESKFKDQITWEICRLKCDTTGGCKYETGWNKVGNGTTCVYRCDTPGIYRLRAKINGKIFTYTRREDAYGGKKSPFLCRGDPDCIGVVHSQNEKNLINSAIEYMMKTHYAKATPWYDPEELDSIFKNSIPPMTPKQKQFAQECSLLRRQIKIYGHHDFANDLKESSKCNLFIYYQAHSCGLDIPAFTYGTLTPPFGKSCAPLVKEWINPEKKIGSWRWMNPANTLPEPGWFEFDKVHAAIIDYDGAGISGGTTDVNKLLYLTFPSSFRKYE